MDFKKKFLSFLTDIRETSAKSPDDEATAAECSFNTSLAKFKEHSIEFTQDPRVDQEAIAKIDPQFYKDDQFDVIEYNLQNLPERLDLAAIEANRTALATQLKAVSRHVSELVLENHPAYQTELQRVMELQQTLNSASEICSKGRRNLHRARQGFTLSSLGLLANHRKRQQLVALLKSLHTIKTLQRTDVRLRELLEEEDYPGAIQLCLECQKAASTYRHYTCISELSSKLQDTLYMIDESMDVALSKTCSHFDEEYYSRIQTAYRLMGKTQAAIDQLHMHFISSVQNTSFTKVLGYVELCSGVGDGSFQKRPYADLCKCIKPEVFMPCLIDLCKALWEMLNSYHKTINWHQRHDMDSHTEPTEGDGGGVVLSQQYIHQKLEQGLSKVWSDVQQKVKVYLLSTDLSHFKYDEFIQVLGIVNRLMEIGDEFCGSRSEGLEESIRKQSVNYFRSYHRSRMDELRMFLENEGWELCPVKSGFTIMMLQEFKFVRQLATAPSEVSSDDAGGVRTGKSNERAGFFKKYSDHGSPFDFQPEDDEGEDVLEVNGYDEERSDQRMMSNDTDSDEDIPDELKQDFIDERTGDQPFKKNLGVTRRRSYRNLGKQPPIITNTTLTVCRLFGKYLQMMVVLQPIAFDVIICMTKLFDYYLYAVYTFFAAEVESSSAANDVLLGSKLRTTLKRIRENIFIEDDAHQQQQPASQTDGMMVPTAPVTLGDERMDKVAHPHISPAVDLQKADGLFGLASRIVATESLMFLTEQFKLLQDRLEDAIPPAKKPFLQQFYSQTLSTAVELRKPVYRSVAGRCIDADHFVQMMSSVKWDVKDIMSQHSTYVDALLQELQLFNRRLDTVSKSVPVPTAVRHALWEHVIRVTNATFVEGFATAKKCTNEGRALMQLDFQQFIIKLEKLTDLRPIPGREYVETYVKAYYLPEAQLESWIADHKEYSGRQLLGLVQCIGHISKKTRQKLIATIEESDKTRR